MAERAKRTTARFAMAAAVVSFPLLFARAPQQEAPRQGDDDESVTDRAVTGGRFDGPKVRAAALLSDKSCERGDPALARTADGRPWLVCVEQQPGVGDRLVAGPLAADGRLDGAMAAVTRAPASISGPVAVAEGDGLRIVWTQVVDGVGQLWCSRGGGGNTGAAPSFTEPRALTSGPLQHRRVAAAQFGAATWLAWEEWTAATGGAGGSFDVWLAPLVPEAPDAPNANDAKGPQLGPRIDVGDGRFGDHEPQLAGSGDALAVAWSQYQGRDEEVVLRRLKPATGELDAPLNVSACAASDDVHPTLAAGAHGELWLAWDARVDSIRGRSQSRRLIELEPPPPDTTVRVACVRGRDVLWPPRRKAAEGATPAGTLPGIPVVALGGAHPRLVVTNDGRAHVATRALEQTATRAQVFAYLVLLHDVDASGIGMPVAIADSGGWTEPVALLADGAALFAAWQHDTRLDNEGGSFNQSFLLAQEKPLTPKKVLLSRTNGPSGIGVARLEAPPAPPAPANVAPPNVAPANPAPADGAGDALLPRAELLSPPHYHPSRDPVGDPIVSGRDHFVVARGAEKYTVFWGDLHRHSNYSRCSSGDEMSPEDRWTFGRDVCLYDFMALTDHSAHVGPREWWRLAQLCELENVPGSFAAVAGFEWSTHAFGHHNVILRGPLEPYFSSHAPRTSTLSNLYGLLKGTEAVAIPHTPADFGRRVDFTRCDPEFAKVVELYQATRGSYEFDGCFKQSNDAVVLGDFATDAPLSLDVGFIASSDHGDGCAYACVLAESLDRAHLFDALKARRTYGATTKGMLVDFRIDDHLMGESFTCDAPPRLHAKVHGTAPLAEVVLFKDGRPWQTAGRHAPAAGAPVQVGLELEVDRDPKPPGEAWRLRVSGDGVAFKSAAHVRRGDPAAQGGVPRWRTGSGDGVFVWPAESIEPLTPDLSRVALIAPLSATLHIAQPVPKSPQSPQSEEQGAAGEITISLADLLEHGCSGRGIRGAWRLIARLAADQSIDLAHGLGVADFEQEWREESVPAARTWYYLRAIQSDGEAAWSSPIYVRPASGK